MSDFGSVKLTHPTRELTDILVPSKYRATKYDPAEGSLVRLRNSDMFDLDEEGNPPYPLVGEIVEVRHLLDWDEEYLVEFLDGIDEWYFAEEIIVIATEGNW